jgi:hypothetical protein
MLVPGFAGHAIPPSMRVDKTLMANVVADPKVHPEVIMPDLIRIDKAGLSANFRYEIRADANKL